MKRFIPILLCVVFVICACGKNQEATLPADEHTSAVKPLSDVLEAEEGSFVFKIRNNIGADIYEVQISPSGLDEYGDDILKTKILKASESMSVAYLPPDSYQYWDLRALTENGNYYIWFDVQLGKFDEITLNMGERGPEFTTN